MLTLAIETSGRSGKVALLAEGRPPVERSLASEGRRHAQTLVAEIDGLFRDAGHSLDSCDLVAVSIGPGSFTGLRVGVVCAKTLAYVAGARLTAVDTFEAVACNAPPEAGELLVIENAQRGGLFVGRYRRRGPDDWTRVGELDIVDAEDWAQARTEADLVTGWGAERVEPLLHGRARLLDRSLWTPTAAAIGRIGLRLAAQQNFADALSLEPFYLRRSAAEEKRGASPGESRG